MFCRLNLLSYFCFVDITINKMNVKATPQELDYQTTKFEDLGFFIEYIVDGRLIGVKNVSTNDRGSVGYESTKHHIAEETIVFKNKKIAKGTAYYTRIYPLCGKVIKNDK